MASGQFAGFGLETRYFFGAPDSEPWGIATGDFTGNGRDDIAVTDRDGGGIWVLLSNPNGTFQPAVRYATGSYTWDVGAHDLNGNGLIDLIATNMHDENISVLMGRGDGTFAEATHFPAGERPSHLAISDLNGNGFPDVVTSGILPTNRVHVLFGAGDGTFSAPVSYEVESDPRGLAIGDVTQNGHQDIVVASRRRSVTGPGTVQILEGDGTGSFQVFATLESGTDCQSVDIGDINGNGIPDIVAGNAAFGDSISVFVGLGQGQFQRDVFTTAIVPLSVTLVDIDGDGILDIVHASRDGLSVAVRLGNGDGTFRFGNNFQINRPQSLAVGDFTGNGVPDVATSARDISAVSVLINQTPVSVPGEFSLEDPPAGATGVELTPTLSWTSSPGFAVSYRLLIASDPDLNDIVYQASDVTELSYRVPFGELPQSQQLYWNVFAENSAGQRAAEAESWAFSTVCVADINADGIIDADDFFAFLTLFANGDPAADINNDGAVNADDFFDFLEIFAQGC